MYINVYKHIWCINAERWRAACISVYISHRLLWRALRRRPSAHHQGAVEFHSRLQLWFQLKEKEQTLDWANGRLWAIDPSPLCQKVDGLSWGLSSTQRPPAGGELQRGAAEEVIFRRSSRRHDCKPVRDQSGGSFLYCQPEHRWSDQHGNKPELNSTFTSQTKSVGDRRTNMAEAASRPESSRLITGTSQFSSPVALC